MRMVGTTSRGIRTPIIKEGDNLANIVVDSVIKASKNEEFKIKKRPCRKGFVTATACGTCKGVKTDNKRN